MLALLTDENISPEVARQIGRKNPAVDVLAMRDFQKGALLGVDDRIILESAHDQQRTLVTRDLCTIPPLLDELTRRGVEYSGVIFVSGASIKPRDIGGLVRALLQTWMQEQDAGRKNRQFFLQAIQSIDATRGF